MNSDAFDIASKLFAELCDLPDTEIKARLDNSELPTKVRELIESDRDATHRSVQQAEKAAAPKSTPAPDVPGFELKERLGEGGMGVVWRAVQTATRREVALKVLARQVVGSERARARFEREVELAATLEHPGIARVYESGVTDEAPYYAMELVEGIELDRYLKQEQLDDQAAVRLFVALGRAVEHAHLRGVIHRDLKPSNVIVRADGQPVVVDFGLAKDFTDGTDEVSLSGLIVGTPAYMSPEQASGGGQPIDTRSDVYSLGVLLFQALSGHSPHDLTGSTLDALRRISETDATTLRQVRNNIDADLDVLVGKALARQPDERYGTAGGLADDLERWLRGDPIEARPPSTFYLLRKRARRQRVPLTIAAALLVAAVAASIAYVNSIRASREETEVYAYGYRVQLAEQALRRQNATEARAFLEDCPPQLRNWEWDFLWAQLDPGPLSD